MMYYISRDLPSELMLGAHGVQVPLRRFQGLHQGEDLEGGHRSLWWGRGEQISCII